MFIRWFRVWPALLCAPPGLMPAPAAEPLPLVPILEIIQPGSQPLWTVARQPQGAHAGGMQQSEVFHAVTSPHWPAGLVPVFAVERKGITELRRRPPRGQENFVEPLFFARPPPRETNAATIAGHWHVRAIHADGHASQLAWELTVVDGEIAGRFDQNTEYRFAFITGGHWRTNRLTLAVEYINDHFEVTGQLINAELIGTWRRLDDSEQGRWTALQTGEVPRREVPGYKEVPLYEWRKAGQSAPRYLTGDVIAEDGWQRAAEPLGLVWRRETAGETSGTPEAR